MKLDLNVNELELLKEVLKTGFSYEIYEEENSEWLYNNQLQRYQNWKRPNKRYIAECEDGIARCQFKAKELRELQTKINEMLGENKNE